MSAHTTGDPRRITGGNVRRERWGDDPLISNERTEAYNQMARRLNHPIERQKFTDHYGELARFNRRLHDLNYPNVPPSIRTKQKPKTSETQPERVASRGGSLHHSQSLKSACHIDSNLQRQASRRAEVQLITLRDQIFEKCKQNHFADQDRITAVIIRKLLQSGIDAETIQSVFETMSYRVIIHEDTSEIEICMDF